MKIRHKKLYQIQNYICFDLSFWLNEMDGTEWNGFVWKYEWKNEWITLWIIFLMIVLIQFECNRLLSSAPRCSLWLHWRGLVDGRTLWGGGDWFSRWTGQSRNNYDTEPQFAKSLSTRKLSDWIQIGRVA